MSDEAMQDIQERLHQDRAFRQQFYLDPLTMLMGYNLTEEEKRGLVLPNFRWLVENKVAGVSYPRSEAALALLREMGVLSSRLSWLLLQLIVSWKRTAR